MHASDINDSPTEDGAGGFIVQFDQMTFPNPPTGTRSIVVKDEFTSLRWKVYGELMNQDTDPMTCKLIIGYTTNGRSQLQTTDISGLFMNYTLLLPIGGHRYILDIVQTFPNYMYEDGVVYASHKALAYLQVFGPDGTIRGITAVFDMTYRNPTPTGVTNTLCEYGDIVTSTFGFHSTSRMLYTKVNWAQLNLDNRDVSTA